MDNEHLLIASCLPCIVPSSSFTLSLPCEVLLSIVPTLLRRSDFAHDIWPLICFVGPFATSLTSCPELVCLLEEGEELDGLLALQPEAILLRWFNYHLERVSNAVVLCLRSLSTIVVGGACAC